MALARKAVFGSDIVLYSMCLLILESKSMREEKIKIKRISDIKEDEKCKYCNEKLGYKDGNITCNRCKINYYYYL